MASRSQVRTSMTLEEFLKLPEDKPYLEYIDGRVAAKVSPQKKHSLIAVRLTPHLNQFAESRGLGPAFVELRCTFAGRSIIPDVTFLLDSHIETDSEGEFVNETWVAPDLHIEIISPDQSLRKSREKLAHSTSNGCPLGWLIDPEGKTIDVFRPGLPSERLAAEGMLEGEPVLPGYRLAAADVFGWLRWRKPDPNIPPTPGAGPV